MHHAGRLPVQAAGPGAVPRLLRREPIDGVSVRAHRAVDTRVQLHRPPHARAARAHPLLRAPLSLLPVRAPGDHPETRRRQEARSRAALQLPSAAGR